MKQEYLRIDGIPSILWGEPSEKLFIFVHGENSSKEEAEEFAGIVGGYGIQTLSFDLPGSGERGNICSACMPEPCDLVHSVRDLRIILDWTRERYPRVSLFVRDHAKFCLEAFSGQEFERLIFVSPDTEVTGFANARVGSPDRFAFDRFIRDSF